MIKWWFYHITDARYFFKNSISRKDQKFQNLKSKLHIWCQQLLCKYYPRSKLRKHWRSGTGWVVQYSPARNNCVTVSLQQNFILFKILWNVFWSLRIARSLKNTFVLARQVKTSFEGVQTTHRWLDMQMTRAGRGPRYDRWAQSTSS